MEAISNFIDLFEHFTTENGKGGEGSRPDLVFLLFIISYFLLYLTLKEYAQGNFFLIKVHLYF
jgi:hypothetical protein